MTDALPASVIHVVLSKMDARDCARASCIDRRWCEVSGEESLWEYFCLRDFAVSSPMDPHENPCDLFKTAYCAWWNTCKGYARPTIIRTKKCLDGIKEWLRNNFVEGLNSMHTGVSREEIYAAEKDLGFELPEPVRLLYSLCDGQNTPEKEYRDAKLGRQCPVVNFVGLLGGYSYYGHFVNVHLLPLQSVVRWTQAWALPPPRSRCIVIGLSFNKLKVFFLDCVDGQVYVGTTNLNDDQEMMPCTPKEEAGVHLKDGLLRWLETYNQRLQTGMYNVRVEHGIRCINLFPEKEPHCTHAITRGVQVRASSVFIPERSRLDGEDGACFLFAYSVRMRLLDLDYMNCNSPLASAQLVERHWVIQPHGEPKEEVRGPAVIGQYPYLQAGGKEFIYQSCSPMDVRSGTIEGAFTFVPGRIASREGAEFAAVVAPFPLEVPDYVF